MKVKFRVAFWLLTCSAWLMIPAASHAQTVIGSWQNNTGDGWIDWSHSGVSITNVAVTNIYSFVDGVVPGYTQSLQVNEAGWNQSLSIKLEDIPGGRAAFVNNNLLTFTFTVPAWTNGGYSQLWGLYVNAGGGYGFTLQPYTTNTWSATGDTGANSASGQPNFYFYNGSPVQSQRVTFNYASILPAITNAGNSATSGYIELIFTFNNGGGAPPYWWMNNVTLSGSPTELTYIVDDFATNGVGPQNPTNDDYFATAEDYSLGDITSVWSEWFGNGGPGGTSVSFSWDPNLDASGNTNSSGAMAIGMTWDAANDGYQQFVAFQGFGVLLVPGGTVGIGYPGYTNLSCDVMFDPSSAGTTNNAGVLGVIRLGIRPVAGGQDWVGPSYTTITDTNWHHINAPLPNNNSDFTDIGGVLIGEDVTAYVGGGGLTGNQILYVDNVKFTGPLVTPVIPPPTLAAPQPAKPGLRIFAGSSANTYDREELYTTDSSQSWVDPGVTYPVEYSYSLQDYNPNIAQIHLELIPGGSSTQYSDYSGPTTLWMVLNPGPAAGQVVCNVQWKTNAPGSNPGGTVNPYGNALSFTNSTAIGTWSLVFINPSNGYVAAPGQVINGPTNFMITDSNIMTQWAEPMVVVFGHQPNSTAGQGQYVDYGMIKVTGVAGVNEFEDFTTEGSDIVGNLTPSGQFNNNASYMAASTIIVTTNDAWWVNWTQPAIGFTLASSTNLANPNWVNPGYYSGYTDTNAPRVMPLAAPFVNHFWVLLPKDDVPTANGQPNASPPAAGPPAPKAFFLVSTNVVSP